MGREAEKLLAQVYAALVVILSHRRTVSGALSLRSSGFRKNELRIDLVKG